MTTDLMIYGDIGQDWWSDDGVTDTMIHEGLQALDQNAAKHCVHLNSPGGRVDMGLTIMNLLRAHKAQMKALNPEFQLETIVDGYALSAASVIFMAGDIRTVCLGGIVMIHDAWSGIYGNAADMRTAADKMDMLSGNIASIYASLCTPALPDASPRDAASFRALMLAETYFVASEAVASGLATREDLTTTANLHSDLTPERLKGNYVETMTAHYKKRTYNKPTASKSILDAKLAMQRFKLLEATIALT